MQLPNEIKLLIGDLRVQLAVALPTGTSDLALAARSITRTLGVSFVEPFYQQYGKQPDPSRITVHMLLLIRALTTESVKREFGVP